MKKRICIILTVFLFSASFSFSQIIDRSEAIKAGINFYYERINAFKETTLSEIEIESVKLHSEGNNKYYYIINFKSKGYIIVSAEKNIHPVIAYSFNSYFEDNINSPSVNSWMKKYELEIKHAYQHNLINPESQDEWDRLLNADTKGFQIKSDKGIEPLLFSTWNQGNYYNTSCPEDPAGPNGHVLTGCVATALGQLLHYYRHPEQGDSAYSYIDENYGLQSVNFSEQTYSYEGMPNHPTDHYIDLTNLLYHIGVSVDMHYGPDGSGMTNHKAAYSMKTFFRYSDSTQYLFRDSTEMDWKQEIINHLDSGMPLYYAGWSDTIFYSGHAFVCDGYQDPDYFHFNWGWGGSYDGYFYLDNLSPGGSNFNLMQELVINMFPKNDYPHYFTGTKFLTTNEGTIDDGSGPVFDYQNNTDCGWQISSADSITSITLNFLRFDLGNGDFLKIYEGTDTLGNLIGSYTGSDLPALLESYTEDMYLWFSSDDTDTAGGFLLEYLADEASFCSTFQTITEPEGTISDGSGSYQYKNSVLCRWYLQAKGATVYNFTITEFDLEPENDVLKFLNENFELMYSFSGNEIPEPFFIESPKVWVSFETNSEITGDGWTFNYSAESSDIKDASTKLILNVYPNPTKNKLYINLEETISENICIKISSIAGQMLYCKENPDVNPYTIAVNNLDPGIYILEIISNKSRYYKKFVIE